MLSLSRSRFSTGMRRRNSSASEIRCEPGRVDSAPISSMSAPSSSNSTARAKARSGSEYFPPSEKESGVTFNTPISKRSLAQHDFTLLQLPLIAFFHSLDYECGRRPGARLRQCARLIVPRDVCRDFERASRLEWLDTNHTGAYAMGTVAGVNTRRYHALLIASLNPPADRYSILPRVEERADRRR